jgi:SAM-dependent methyltransferase
LRKRFPWQPIQEPFMPETPADGPNAAMIAYWNDSAGPSWVAAQEVLDAQLRPLGLAAIKALDPKPGERLLDVGCGAGETALELARRVGPSGAVLGADISGPLLGRARQRAEAAGLTNASFKQTDAQTDEFQPVDGVFSRFGVMFFDDPTAAFLNLRHALKPGGRLVFVCWRPLAENAWMTVPTAAIAPLLPAPPPPPIPNAPGPFAFADKDRVHAILEAAGFAHIHIAPHDEKIGGGDLDLAARTTLSVGPVAMAVRQNPALKDRMVAAVREALKAHQGPDGQVLLPSATWIVTARP